MNLGNEVAVRPALTSMERLDFHGRFMQRAGEGGLKEGLGCWSRAVTGRVA